MSNDSPFSLARDVRLRKRRDFLRVQRYGNKISSKHFVTISQKNSASVVGKLGITVPKKVGPAHERNLLKRRIRHIARHNKKFFCGFNIVVIARESANKANFISLEADLLESIKKISSHTKTDQRRVFAAPHLRR